MKGHLLMSFKELGRKTVLEQVKLGILTLVEGSRRIGLSYRQTLRVYERFVSEGDAGLVHQGRGRPSNRRHAETLRNEILRRYVERFQVHGFGPTLAAEKLAEEGLCVDHETLRRWLVEAGHWKACQRKPVHRTWRERRAHFGELVQMDGSHHDWFGPEHGKSCLMNMVDDATGRTMALMSAQETTEAAMNLLRRWIERHGVPMALYTDRKNVYITDREPTLEEQLAGEEPLTAFGKACHKLGIEIIPAYSPQAKGRVERFNGTYQDRFVKELALRGITTIAQADELLAGSFSEGLNKRFAVAPAQQADFHRPLFKGLDLDDVFCHETHRVVQNDWTISHESRRYQILKASKPLPKPKDRILVRTHLDGRVELHHQGKPLLFRLLARGEARPEDSPPIKAIETSAKPVGRPKPPPPKKRWHANCDRITAMRQAKP